jgi:hypothetical protein
MQTNISNKMATVPEHKLVGRSAIYPSGLTGEEAAELGRQVLLRAEAEQRARDDADPWIVAGRHNAEEAAYIAASEARLELPKAELQAAILDLKAAEANESRVRYARSRFEDDDPQQTAAIAAATAITSAARAAHDAAYRRLVEATREEAALQATVTGPRVRQAAVARARNAEGERQYRAQVEAAAKAAQADAKATAERFARMQAEAGEVAEVRRRRIFGGAK